MKIPSILAVSAVVLTLTTAQSKPIHSNDAPPETQGNVNTSVLLMYFFGFLAYKEEASQILFGERGILTGIFRMMDQQKKVQMAPQHDTAAADSGKIGEDIRLNLFSHWRIMTKLCAVTDREASAVIGFTTSWHCSEWIWWFRKFRFQKDRRHAGIGFRIKRRTRRSWNRTARVFGDL